MIKLTPPQRATMLNLEIVRVRAIAQQFAGASASAVTKLQRDGGVFSFSAGAHVFRHAGVTGSATSGEAQAVSSWIYGAERKVAKLKADR